MEARLGMYYWNDTEGGWAICETTGVDTVNNIVWANVTHLTIFAPMAEKVAKAEAPPLNWFLYAGLIVIIIVVLASAGISVKRRKKASPPEKPAGK